MWLKPRSGLPLPDHLQLDTCGGRVRVEWDAHAPVTPLGQLVFFAQFLQISGRFDLWVKDCPWVYTSPNAPAVRDVCGTVLLSVLSGHHRYAHVSALRGDRVNAPLLGMDQAVSEDSVRRGLAKGHGQPEDETAVAHWQQRHLRESYAPLLGVPWVLDVDSTIKTIYGHQEGAEVGYNPHKRGRPSHVYHTYLMGAARLVLDVEVQPGKQTAAQHAMPGLWRLLDSLPASAQPTLVRGDCAFGQEGVLAEAEARHQAYLFKLRLTRRPKDLIRLLEQQGQWQEAGQGWKGREGVLQLQGWSRPRRVIVLRRLLKTSPTPVPAAQRLLDWSQPFATSAPAYEYAVLVTSLKLEVLAVAQMYRDRGDAETTSTNSSTSGAVWASPRPISTVPGDGATHRADRQLVEPVCAAGRSKRAAEAITSRPLLLHAVAARARTPDKRW